MINLTIQIAAEEAQELQPVLLHARRCATRLIEKARENEDPMLDEGLTDEQQWCGSAMRVTLKRAQKTSADEPQSPASSRELDAAIDSDRMRP